MNGEDIDIPIDLLIDEIEKRDAIWNLKAKDYSNKIIKKKAWEELVLIFCNYGDSEEKKKNLGSILQKKWKNLRDTYVKELKKNKNLRSGSSASTSSFALFQRLSFLKPIVQKRATDDSFDVEETLPNIELNSMNSSVKSPTDNVPPKKYKLHPADEHFANILERCINKKNVTEKKEEDDEDKLFCLSLVKEIKKVPENRRLKLKIEMYHLLERYQSAQTQRLEDVLPSHNYPSTSPSQNHPSTSYSSQQYNKPQRQTRNYPTASTSSQYSDPMRYFDHECTSQRQPNNYPTVFPSSQHSDTMRYFSDHESSTYYGYTTSPSTSPPTNSSQITSPVSFEDSQEIDLFKNETIH